MKTDYWNVNVRFRRGLPITYTCPGKDDAFVEAARLTNEARNSLFGMCLGLKSITISHHVNGKRKGNVYRYGAKGVPMDLVWENAVDIPS